ncbi:F-box protein 30 [Mytilus galloprovincialis]|uniref:F-box protein 30 n=1 Tax=Mytilus galloprovincialis TaxID=29158 RepID=A0A8B6BHM5_MYTGA|nr:F-box protein 30 [Mytilus galloprovincialis]
MQQERFSSIHDHCVQCFIWKCDVRPDYVTSCELIECVQGCDRIFHACKQKSHSFVCEAIIVPCINKENGCHSEVKKSNMAAHLLICPANVIDCMTAIPETVKICHKPVKRGEFSWHSRNIHAEISTGILELKCPLAYAGCDFSCQKLSPLVPTGHVTQSDLLNTSGLTFGSDACSSPEQSGEQSKTLDNPTTSCYQNDVDSTGGLFFLEDLPDNVIEQILMFLDSFSINNLALTCKFLRSFCKSVVYNKGIVVPVWQKISNGGKHWDFFKWKWSFSSACTPIRKWKYHLSTPVSEHLKVCPFYPERIIKDELIPCENECGFTMYRHQLVEHKKRCQMEMVNCLNKYGGCVADVLRSKMAAHLRRCPANIVQCNSRNVRPEMNGICQQVFRREELAGHQQFSHLDICEPTKQYCPLAYQGCKFTIDKKTPQVPNGEVIFCKDTNSFNVSRKDREQISDDKDTEGEEASLYHGTTSGNMASMVASNQPSDAHQESLLSLPFTLLYLILSDLDSLSIYNLSITCRYLREACEDMLPVKGVVEAVWKKTNDGWEISERKWRYTTACTLVKQWQQHLSSPITEHLKECSYYGHAIVNPEKVKVMFDLKE